MIEHLAVAQKDVAPFFESALPAATLSDFADKHDLSSHAILRAVAAGVRACHYSHDQPAPMMPGSELILDLYFGVGAFSGRRLFISSSSSSDGDDESENSLLLMGGSDDDDEDDDTGEGGGEEAPAELVQAASW